jgi:hypothetical protein
MLSLRAAFEKDKVEHFLEHATERADRKRPELVLEP